MIGLAAWVLAWVIWVLGRPFWYQGLSQGLWCNTLIGMAYLLLALVSRNASLALLMAACCWSVWPPPVSPLRCSAFARATAWCATA
jgi:hypothetical protein